MSNFYKNEKYFDLQDLKILMKLYNVRKRKIQSNPYLTDREKSFLIIEYNKRVRELRREFKHKATRREMGVSEDRGLGDVQLITLAMLSRLGFDSNSLYKEDVLNLSHNFYLSYDWSRRHGKVSNNLLASAIVVEVLDHYLVTYDFDKFLDDEYIDLEDFKSIYPLVNEWANYYYWK